MACSGSHAKTRSPLNRFGQETLLRRECGYSNTLSQSESPQDLFSKQYRGIKYLSLLSRTQTCGWDSVTRTTGLACVWSRLQPSKLRFRTESQSQNRSKYANQESRYRYCPMGGTTRHVLWDGCDFEQCLCELRDTAESVEELNFSTPAQI